MPEPVKRELPARPERPKETEAPVERPRPAAERPVERPDVDVGATPATTTLPQSIPKLASIPLPKDPLTKKIESILEEDLADVYLSMNEKDRLKFKQKGEETTGKIKELLARAHVKVKEIVNLLIDWLKLIPGVNRFFLEQEAKIKADKLLAIKK